jgi:hypothetical protein
MWLDHPGDRLAIVLVLAGVAVAVFTAMHFVDKWLNRPGQPKRRLPR